MDMVGHDGRDGLWNANAVRVLTVWCRRHTLRSLSDHDDDDCDAPRETVRDRLVGIIMVTSGTERDDGHDERG